MGGALQRRRVSDHRRGAELGGKRVGRALPVPPEWNLPAVVWDGAPARRAGAMEALSTRRVKRLRGWGWIQDAFQSRPSAEAA